MAIPESQLMVWAKQGPIDSSSKTYQSIKLALERTESPIHSKIRSGGIKIYLQGSYDNDTNIRGDSDVDVVVELTSAFNSNKIELPSDQYLLHEQSYPQATYNWTDLKRDVIKALEGYYGEEFVDTDGNKSIKIVPNSGRLRADVVPVTTYRKYTRFNGKYNHSKEEGVSLYHKTTGELVVNYPKIHYESGVQKHTDTNEWFKPTVRIIKNMASYLVDQGDLDDSDAPSYFLQCLVYNVPSNLFGGSYAQTIGNVLDYLASANLSAFVCQHKMYTVFGTESNHWNMADAQKTIAALIELRDHWYA